MSKNKLFILKNEKKAYLTSNDITIVSLSYSLYFKDKNMVMFDGKTTFRNVDISIIR